MRYKRLYVQGGTHFFTVITARRFPIFADPRAVDTLREAFHWLKPQKPFEIIASVIMPDHLHFVWSLPEGDSDYSTRWRLIKRYVSQKLPTSHPPDTYSRADKKESSVWQRRFWEHRILDEKDLANHIEYIHFNPVKHGLAHAPVDWPYSSFHIFVREGLYPADWGADSEVWSGSKWME